MGVLKTTIAIAATASILGGSALADEDGAEPVVRWNSLTYQLQNQEAAARWSASSLHGKALVQGLEFDSAGNMYVTTARWEAELQAAVRAEVVLPSDTDGLTADKDGNVYLTALQLNPVLKWEPATRRLSRIAYHPEMVWPDTLAWAPDGTLHVISNHLHVWVDQDMDFENPSVPNFTIWHLPAKAEPYLN